jgi:DNA-binding response OmpR family regulator
MRVLLAEDDPILASVVIEALGDEGHTVTHVTQAAEVQRLAAAENWDAFVVDAFGVGFDQPDPNERTHLRALAEHGPVILASGRAWVNTFQPADLGVAAIMPKPYDLDNLLAAIAAIGRGAAGSARS